MTMTFEVKDMSCGHCTSTITKALQAADPHARFNIDLSRQLVLIESTHVAPADLQQAIAQAGFTPQLL